MLEACEGMFYVHLEISNSDGRCGELNGATVFIGQSWARTTSKAPVISLSKKL